MHQVTQWQQTGVYDPYNPNQIIREPNNIGIPGGAYGSFYFNKVPTTVTQVLGGLRGSMSGLPVFLQVGIVGSLAAVAGYYSWRFLGPKLGVKGMSGLGGRRRRRRR